LSSLQHHVIYTGNKRGEKAVEHVLLTDMLIIFGLSIIVLFICNRVGLPAIVGLLLTGMLAGPHGFRLVRAVDEVEIFAEIGVILLLFTIGIEFSLKSLLQIKRTVLLGGSLQALFTIAAVSAVANIFGRGMGESIFIGFLITLSSTAIVLKVLQEKADVDSPHGHATLATLIFQDIMVVPMVLVTPLLAGGVQNPADGLLPILIKAAGTMVVVFVSAKFIVPQILYQAARTGIRELFLLTLFVICLMVVWLTSSMGLSLALGAFLAGLIVSESEYSHQALGNLLPFRDVFTSFFFLSIGMLLNIDFLLGHILIVAAITLLVLTGKAVIAGAVTLILGYPLRTAILTGLALNQLGEFSFILSKNGLAHGFLVGDSYQLFLAVAVLTMAAAPIIMDSAPRMADLLVRIPLPDRLKTRCDSCTVSGRFESKKDHLVIIGFGFNGRNLSRAARVAGIDYVIVDTNADTVRMEQQKGEAIFFGDATHDTVLKHANINRARIVVIAINDAAATRRITVGVRKLNPKVLIIVRTAYIKETKALYDLGADEVIPEEYETSVEIFTRVLMKYLIPRDEIEKFIQEIRSKDYKMFRTLSPVSSSLPDLHTQIPDIEITALRVSGDASWAGKTLADIALRTKFGITALAIRRDSTILSNPGGSTSLQPDDVLIVLGQSDQTVELARFLRGEEPKTEA
jgi:CPA2 family monovalent cation:H+ antiporter-2